MGSWLVHRDKASADRQIPAGRSRSVLKGHTSPEVGSKKPGKHLVVKGLLSMPLKSWKAFQKTKCSDMLEPQPIQYNPFQFDSLSCSTGRSIRLSFQLIGPPQMLRAQPVRIWSPQAQGFETHHIRVQSLHVRLGGKKFHFTRGKLGSRTSIECLALPEIIMENHHLFRFRISSSESKRGPST